MMDRWRQIARRELEDRYEVRLAGEGGQGMILAGIILAEAAAVYDGLNAVQTQSYGPEARGGASRSEVVIAHGEIDYPKVLNPDLVLSMSQEACDRFCDRVKEDGLVVIGLWPSQVLTEFIVESIEKGDIELDEEHAETPLYTGRVIAALANDPDKPARSGLVFTTAELALHYDIRDERGKQPTGKRNPTLFREPI